MARNLKIYATEALYQADKEALTLVCPNVSKIAENGNLHYLKQNPETGVGIKDISGNYYTREQWNALPSPKPTAVGVYVRSDEAKFVSGNTVMLRTWGDDYHLVPNCNTYTYATPEQRHLAYTDYAGKNNTDACLADVAGGGQTSAPAAAYCRGYNFGDGSEGYLLACGELKILFMNILEVNLCRTALGWPELSTSEWYWSSTQTDSRSAWLRSMSSGSEAFSTFYKTNWQHSNIYAIPVCAL